MRHRCPRAAMTAAIAVPMMALTFAVCGGAFPAAASTGLTSAASIHGNRITDHGAAARRSRAAALTWHKLTLINGWTSSQGSYGTGDPAYAIKAGVVYLSGSLHGGTNEQFAVLPAAARPTRWLYLTVYTFSGTSGTLRIEPNGAMAAYSTPGSGATNFTSLAAVSFPTAKINRHKLTLINGWTSSQGSYGTGDPAYAIKGGIVYLSGSLHGGTALLPFSLLPAAARPTRDSYRTVYAFGGTSSYLINLHTGQMGFGPGAQRFASLAGVSYPTSKVIWHRLSLINGWMPQVAGDPAYSIVGGVVYLSGSMHQPSGINDKFAILPPAARPAHTLYITVVMTGGAVGTLRIPPDGHVSADSFLLPAAARAFTSLAAISYPRNS